MELVITGGLHSTTVLMVNILSLLGGTKCFMIVSIVNDKIGLCSTAHYIVCNTLLHGTS